MQAEGENCFISFLVDYIISTSTCNLFKVASVAGKPEKSFLATEGSADSMIPVVENQPISPQKTFSKKRHI